MAYLFVLGLVGLALIMVAVNMTATFITEVIRKVKTKIEEGKAGTTETEPL